MRQFMINLVPEYDATDEIENPTMKLIYQYMKSGRIYTRKDIARDLKLPQPTVTSRVSDLIMRHFIVETQDVWDEDAKRYIGGVRRV